MASAALEQLRKFLRGLSVDEAALTRIEQLCVESIADYAGYRR